MDEDVKPSTRSKNRQSNGSSPCETPEFEVPPKEIKEEQDETPTDTNNGGKAKGKSNRTSARKRKSSLVDGAQVCPVCGITVRPVDLDQHFQYEIQQLDQIVKRQRIMRESRASYALAKERLRNDERERAEQRNKKKVKRRPRARRSRDYTSDETRSSSDDSEDDKKIDKYLTFLEVRANRHARERMKELAKNPSCNPETMLCPVCFQPLTGSEVERNQHVESCLTKPSTSTSVNGAQDDNSSVDVEAGEGWMKVKEEEDQEEEENEEGGYECYEWMGETRVRAVSLVPGGYQGLGYQTVSTKVKTEVKEEEDDDDLDVDGDETVEFGAQQYTEEDIGARCPSRSSHDTGDVGYEDHVSDNMLIDGCLGNGMEVDDPLDAKQNSKSKDFTVKHVGLPTSGIHMVMESLKARVKELEEAAGDGRGRLKCQICMDGYRVPLVSIQCWHVHCEQCWLQSLASKKLCPQCQMITAPSQLRRIYL